MGAGIDVATGLLPALALLGLIYVLLRRYGRRVDPGGASIRVRGRTALSRSSVVAVVEVDSRRYLVGGSDHGVDLLDELRPGPPDQADDQHAGAGELSSGPAHLTSPHPTDSGGLGRNRRSEAGVLGRLQRMTMRTYVEGDLSERR